MSVYRYTVIFEPDLEEGGWVARVPALGDLATQGETPEEVRTMAQELVEGYLEGLVSEGQPIPEEPPSWGEQVRTEHLSVSV